MNMVMIRANTIGGHVVYLNADYIESIEHGDRPDTCVVGMTADEDCSFYQLAHPAEKVAMATGARLVTL